MSKEKLQEIREIWSNKETEGDTSFFNLPYITHDDVVELMKLSYNQALEDAVNNAEVDEIYDNPINPSMGHTYGVDQQSILKLKL